jgi:hypothetical protein
LRLLTLHARGRAAGSISCALAGVAVACWALALLVRDTGMLIPVLGPLAATSLLGCALGAADPTLERVTPRRWARWRATELAVCTVAATLALLPALVVSEDHVAEGLRNLAGLGGLTAIGVVTLGARLAWLVPTAYAFTGAALGPRTEAWLTPLTWPVDTGTAALAIATALAIAGAALHARHGAPASPFSTRASVL